MNKKIRRDKTFLKYKKRIALLAANTDHYITKDGTDIYKPKTIDIINDKGFLSLKTQATLCSCYGCSGCYKYKRHLKKKEDNYLKNLQLSS